MNIVKRFFQGSPIESIEQAIMIPKGQLYLVRTPNSPKSENECLYNDDVILSLKDYQLVVWKSEIDDEDEDSDENDEEEGEFAETSILETFDLKENSLICLFERYKQKIITWRDLEGDLGDMYEYRISSDVPYDAIEQFMIAIYKSLYEIKYHQSSEDVKLEELVEFVVKRSDIEMSIASKETRSGSNDNEGLFVKSDSEDDDDDDDDDDFVDAKDTLESKVGLGSTLNNVPCDVELYNLSIAEFGRMDSNCEALILKLDDWQYFVEVLNNNQSEVLLQAKIDEDLYPEFNNNEASLVFNQMTLRGVYTWKLLFKQNSHYSSFQQVFSRSLWETKNRIEFPNDDYITRTMGDLDLGSDSDPTDDNEDIDSDSNNNRSHATLLRNDQLSMGDKKVHNNVTEEYNSGLKVGTKTDRAFVSRGNKLGIFKADDQLEFVTSISGIASKNYSNINVDQMMLLNGDSTMIIQDKHKLNTLHSLDLEKGTIVQNFELSKDSTDKDIKVFTTNSKFSGASHEDTFLGGTAQAMFRIDQRMKNGFVSNDEYKEYKTKLGISAITTTVDGMIAIATNDGSIKLYDALGKNAKTALPPLGDEVISLDTTGNSRYLIATCRKYILLIDLKIKEGKYKGELGFNRSFPADSKPEPRRLRLQPGYMAPLIRLYGKGVEFTPAKFDNNSKTIISSMGRYSFIWDLKNVLNGDKYPTKIREYGEEVIMGDFSNNINQVLIAMKNDVALTSKNAFDNPKDAFNVVRNAF